jgi:hypothetical protein
MSPDETPPRRPRLPDFLLHCSSRLDASGGPLHSTSDGNLVREETGDWLALDTPPHNVEGREIAIEKDKKASRGPSLTVPKAKNGATALDDPRARKPIARLIRNKLSGSDRPPIDTEDTTLAVKETLRTEIAAQKEMNEQKVHMSVMEEVKKYYGVRIARQLGGDWFEHALVDGEFCLQVLDRVMAIDEELALGLRRMMRKRWVFAA